MLAGTTCARPKSCGRAAREPAIEKIVVALFELPRARGRHLRAAELRPAHFLLIAALHGCFALHALACVATAAFAARVLRHVATLDLAHGLEGYLATHASRDDGEEQFRCATHIPRALGRGGLYERYVSRDLSSLALQSDIQLIVCRPKRLFLLGRSRSHKPSRPPCCALVCASALVA